MDGIDQPTSRAISALVNETVAVRLENLFLQGFLDDRRLVYHIHVLHHLFVFKLGKDLYGFKE